MTQGCHGRQEQINTVLLHSNSNAQPVQQGGEADISLPGQSLSSHKKLFAPTIRHSMALSHPPTAALCQPAAQKKGNAPTSKAKPFQPLCPSSLPVTAARNTALRNVQIGMFSRGTGCPGSATRVIPQHHPQDAIEFVGKEFQS